MRDPQIFYYCYDHDRPTGGQRDTYRHVDVLNAAGYDAFVLHTDDGYRLKWFSNETRVVSMSHFWTIYSKERDFIVLPEDCGTSLNSFPGRKIIFNKGLFQGFKALGWRRPGRYPWLSADVVAAFTVSDHNAQHLAYAYPNLPIMRVYSEIDESIFAFAPIEIKKKQIACVPKAPDSLLALYHLLHSRADQGLNVFREYDWIIISNKTEAEVCQILHDSLLLIFLGVEEGLPRTPLEAMSCGCLVAAYSGGPMQECLPKEYQFPHGDLLGMARFIESVTRGFPDDIDRWKALVAVGRDYARRYSSELQRESIIAAWNRILTGTAGNLACQ